LTDERVAGVPFFSFPGPDLNGYYLSLLKILSQQNWDRCGSQERRGERRMLTALAQYPEGRSKVQVAVLAGYAATGGGFNNYLGALRSRGLIEGYGDRLGITEAGVQALGS
jgi:hypothetical protein